MQSREELISSLIEHLGRWQGRMRARPSSAWTGLDLTMPQAKTLFYLADGPRRMSDIAGRLGVEMPSATTMIGRLVAKGLVERQQDPADRRAVVCSLTAAGRDAVEKFWSLRAARTEALAAALTTEELEIVVPAMEIMANAVRRPGFRESVREHGALDREGQTEEASL
jgi:DNA-binding MarR family transcriptional regulator